jgi:hypothetical protein
VIEAGLAPGGGDEIATHATGGVQMLAVSQALPSLSHIEVAPVAEVEVIAFVGHPRKCAMPLGEIRRKEVPATVPARRSASPCGQEPRSMSQSSQ